MKIQGEREWCSRVADTLACLRVWGHHCISFATRQPRTLRLWLVFLTEMVAVESKQMTIPNASSCTRLLTPSFSLYRFVISRTSGAQYICPLSSRTAQRTNAGPAQAVTTSESRGLPVPVSARRTGNHSRHGARIAPSQIDANGARFRVIVTVSFRLGVPVIVKFQIQRRS